LDYFHGELSTVSLRFWGISLPRDDVSSAIVDITFGRRKPMDFRAARQQRPLRPSHRSRGLTL